MIFYAPSISSFFLVLRNIPQVRLSHRLNHTPTPKIHHVPQLHMCNSVRGDPYAHPQHSKVLKHFVCLTYDIAVGCNLCLFGGTRILVLEDTPQVSENHTSPAKLLSSERGYPYANP
jgi:hypothetical protein